MQRMIAMGSGSESTKVFFHDYTSETPPTVIPTGFKAKYILMSFLVSNVTDCQMVYDVNDTDHPDKYHRLYNDRATTAYRSIGETGIQGGILSIDDDKITIAATAYKLIILAVG